MREIQLTHGHVALVDDEDFEVVNQFIWYPRKGVSTIYARANDYENKKQRRVDMHRLVMNAQPGQVVDHINCNGLDNRKENLRICTHTQNQWNQNKQITWEGKPCSSKYRGVSWKKQNKKWSAVISYNGKQFWIGVFNKEDDAALAYNKKAKELYGEYAQFNTVEGEEVKLLDICV